MKWAVLTDALDSEHKLEIFDDYTKAFSYFAREIIRLLEVAKEAGYEPQEVLRQGKPEEIEAEVEGFKLLLIVKIDYDIRECDIIAPGVLGRKYASLK